MSQNREPPRPAPVTHLDRLSANKDPQPQRACGSGVVKRERGRTSAMQCGGGQRESTQLLQVGTHTHTPSVYGPLRIQHQPPVVPPSWKKPSMPKAATKVTSTAGMPQQMAWNTEKRGLVRDVTRSQMKTATQSVHRKLAMGKYIERTA